MCLLLINPLKFVRDHVKILEEFNHFHMPRIISEIVGELFFINIKGIKHMLLLIITIKHCIYLVAPLFTSHA